MSRAKNNISFSGIFHNKENLVIIFADDLWENYQSVTQLTQLVHSVNHKNNGGESHKSIFKKIYFLFPDFQITFFQTLLSQYEVNVKDQKFMLPRQAEGVIVNLSINNSLTKKWLNNPHKVVVGRGKNINVKFVPPIERSDLIIKKVIELLNLPPIKSDFSIHNTSFNSQKVGTSSTNGKYVLAINGFLMRKLVLRKLFKLNTPIKKSDMVICPTKTKILLTPDRPLNLEEIVLQCYGSDKIITDDPKLEKLLQKLDFKVYSCTRYLAS